MASEAVAEWLDDGFLHPNARLTAEFVDVDDFLRIPIDGLAEIIQFARVLVGDVTVIVFGLKGEHFRSVLENEFRARHPDARQVFLSSEGSGLVRVGGDDLSKVDAMAVAVTQFRCAWDESAEIKVGNDRDAFLVTVTYQDEKYFVSARMEPVA
jgi:hypothetical protein